MEGGYTLRIDFAVDVFSGSVDGRRKFPAPPRPVRWSCSCCCAIREIFLVNYFWRMI